MRVFDRHYSLFGFGCNVARVGERRVIHNQITTAGVFAAVI